MESQDKRTRVQAKLEKASQSHVLANFDKLTDV